KAGRACENRRRFFATDSRRIKNPDPNGARKNRSISDSANWIASRRHLENGRAYRSPRPSQIHPALHMLFLLQGTTCPDQSSSHVTLASSSPGDCSSQSHIHILWVTRQNKSTVTAH